jgi:hypothetical protein
MKKNDSFHENFFGGEKNLWKSLDFRGLLDEFEFQCCFGMSKFEKRWFIERLIKLAKSPDEVWSVVKCAENSSYSLTKEQNKNIISKLVQFSSVSEMKNVENYAISNGLRFHYVMNVTEKDVAKVLYDH